MTAWGERWVGAVRAWWPLPVIVLTAVTVQAVWSTRYDLPGGHADAHFSDATFVFGALAAMAVVVWAVDRPSRRRLELWLLVVAVAAAAIASAAGNLRVVDSIGPDNWTDDEALALGPARSGFDSGHELAERADMALAVLVGLLAFALWQRRRISPRFAIAVMILAALLPAAYVTSRLATALLVIAALMGRRKRRRADGSGPAVAARP